MRSGAQGQRDSIGEQNRKLLTNDDGSLTERGRTIIITRRRAARFGEPKALVGVLTWLCGPAPASPDRIVVPVDNGCSAFGEF